MAYPDELLVEGERVVLHRRPHGRLLAGPVLAFLLTLGVAGYLAALARGQGWQQWGWPAVAGAAALLVAWLEVAPVVRWRTTHLVVTTRRVLGHGSLVIDGGAHGEVEFVDVPDVDGVRAVLEQEPPS